MLLLGKDAFLGFSDPSSVHVLSSEIDPYIHRIKPGMHLQIDHSRTSRRPRIREAPSCHLDFQFYVDTMGYACMRSIHSSGIIHVDDVSYRNMHVCRRNDLQTESYFHILHSVVLIRAVVPYSRINITLHEPLRISDHFFAVIFKPPGIVDYRFRAKRFRCTSHCAQPAARAFNYSFSVIAEIKTCPLS